MTERARSLFGSTPLVSHVAQLLQRSLASRQTSSAIASEEALWKAQTQLARVVGNLVLDHRMYLLCAPLRDGYLTPRSS